MKTKHIYVISSICILLIPSCRNKGNLTEDRENLPSDIVELREDQIKLAKIELGRIEKREMYNSLKVNGVISVPAQERASICLPMGGYVKKINVGVGVHVQKGTTIALVENQEYVDLQQQFIEAKNRLSYAEAEYKRHKELYKDDVYSEKNLQQVTVEYKNLKSTVVSLSEKLSIVGINSDRLNENNISSVIAVKSPISGSITAANINLGKYVSSSDVMFEIMNTDNLLLELTLFDKDADVAKVGEKIAFVINNETELHDARICLTSKSINNDKTFKIYANVLEKCKNLLPGMYVNATIATAGKETTCLPLEAVSSFNDKNYIFVLERNKTEKGKNFTEYKMIEVKTGKTDKNYIEVIPPKEFDVQQNKIVVKGAYQLLSAMKNAGEMAC